MAKWGEVIEITEFKQIGDKGDIITMYRYRAKSKAGTVFTLELPEGDIAPDKVDAALAKKAELLDKTKSL